MKGRGFRCGSDEKMMRMWFGLEIDVVGLPPLVKQWLSMSVEFRFRDNSDTFFFAKGITSFKDFTAADE